MDTYYRNTAYLIKGKVWENKKRISFGNMHVDKLMYVEGTLKLNQ